MTLPTPLKDPLGDAHHADVPPTSDDQALGAHLAWFMGDLFLNSWRDAPAAQWTAVARALRLHGLVIVDAPRGAVR